MEVGRLEMLDKRAGITSITYHQSFITYKKKYETQELAPNS